MRWSATIVLVCVLTACLGGNSDSNNPDRDEDGHVSSEDCDDSNPAINPDADELCDELDNDCDEEIDEEAIDAVAFFADTDGDTYGDANSVVMACALPEGYVTDDTDCNDGNAAINPDADEVCDEFMVDEDCDGFRNDDDADIACPILILDLTTVMCGLVGESIWSFNEERSPSYMSLAECPSPNKTNATDGGALTEDVAVLEDGTQYTGGLIYVYPPENDTPAAQINLLLPFYTVEAGDRLRMTIGCADANSTCDALVQVNQQNTAGDLGGIISTIETHDGTVLEVDADLSPYVGTQRQFIFLVTNNGNAGADGIYFANPQVVRLSQ